MFGCALHHASTSSFRKDGYLGKQVPPLQDTATANSEHSATYCDGCSQTEILSNAIYRCLEQVGVVEQEWSGF